jgi:ribosomal protein S12 methylthiotransferase
MEGQLPAKTKIARYKKAMKLQQKIAREIAAAHVGKTLRVLVEKPLAGRTASDAPDVDCQVILGKPARVGEFADVVITGTQGYDLVA